MPLKYRDAELDELERIQRRLPRHHSHALIIGMRQVGKTTLARAHLDRARTAGALTAFIPGASITSPAIFFRSVYEGLVDALGGTQVASTTLVEISQAATRTGSTALNNLLSLYAQTWDGGADPSSLVTNAWGLPERLGQEQSLDVVVVVDEIQEVFHQFARTAPFKGGGGLMKSAWDARGLIQHNERALWVFTTSIRSAVNQFFRHDGSPFYLQTKEVAVKPLAPIDARALLADLADPRDGPTEPALDAIAELSGGLPGIAIHLIEDCPPGADKMDVEAAVAASLRHGRLAALYTDITADLSRSERHGGALLLQTLHALARGNTGNRALARKLAVKDPYAANLVASLERLGLIEKVGRARTFAYPLMREWLLAQPAPPIGAEANDAELRTQLGFGFEARVRELFGKIRTPFTIDDNADGAYTLRPGASVTMGGFQRVHRHPGPPEIDVIAHEDHDRTLVAGCRYRREHTSGETIRLFDEDQLTAARREYPNVRGLYVSASPFTQGALLEAGNRNITLLTLAGLNVLARAVREQPFTAP